MEKLRLVNEINVLKIKERDRVQLEYPGVISDNGAHIQLR